MPYSLQYELPSSVLQEIGVVVALRRTNRDEFRKRIKALLLLSEEASIRSTVEMELAIRLAWGAREWSKKRPLKTSWRGFSLGAAVATDEWIYDAYNFKPLLDTGAEEHGYPKVRICAEQLAMVHANDANDIDFRLIVLVGYHHDNGDDHLPKPCGACLRFFTTLPGHRDITMVMINSETCETVMRTLGEIIDSAELPAMECTCCTTAMVEQVDIENKYPHM